MTFAEQPRIFDTTRRWTGEGIGPNLCPFARRVFHDNLIRYRVTGSEGAENLWTELERELALLREKPEISGGFRTILVERKDGHERRFFRCLRLTTIVRKRTHCVRETGDDGQTLFRSF